MKSIPGGNCIARTIEQRLFDVAVEMESLSQLTEGYYFSLSDIFDRILERDYKAAKLRAIKLGATKK